MKALKISICLLLLSAATFAGKSPNSNVSVLSMKRDIFYFKVCPSLIGAQVDVYGDDGKLIASENINHRKSIVDFYFEKPGHYTIRITKGDRSETFQFDKTSPSPFVETAPEYHVSIQ